MNKPILLLLIVLMSSGLLFSAIYEFYTFTTTTGTYSEIIGTAIPDIHFDDAISEPIPIGFTFPYGIDAFNQVKVSSNGWIGLGTAATNSNLSNNLNQQTNYHVIAPLWDDISLFGGTCQYLTTGTAPNRIFTVQYQNAKWNYGADNQFNFQVKFHENGNVAFIYGPSIGTPVFPSASIGINIVPSGTNNFYSVTPGNPATASYTFENMNVSTFPGNGIVYEFITAVSSPNDLAALAISGNTTPTVGTASNYVVNVRNMGSNPQTNYVVRIRTTTETLASVIGPAIAPGTTIQVPISWTPATAGPLSIYGSVVLTGDENPLNNDSSPINVIVQPEGTTAITVGIGDELANIPVNMYWRNSLFETIYQAGEIPVSGLITSIAFYNNFVTNLPNMPTKIWLGLTQQNDLSTGWIPSTQMIEVFDGIVDYPSGMNTIMIPLSTPFMYPGGNLVMMVNRPMDNTYYNWTDLFASQTVGTNRSLTAFSDVTNFDPANPPDGVGDLSGQFPKTTFYLSVGGTNPQFGVSPTSKNFGNVLMNSSHSQLFNVFNVGGGTLTVSSITITGSHFFTLTNIPTLPATLSTGQIISFRALYNPTAAGNHTATITLTDNLTRTQHFVQLSGNCIDPTIYTSPYAQNFDAVTAPNLPIDWNKLISPTGQEASISTVSYASFSPPNSVLLSNGFTTDVNILLIAPPLGAALNLNGMRVKFRANGPAGAALVVGVIADITDHATFTDIQTINLSETWQEYIVSLAPYAGTGRYIAFKHGNSSWFQYIYIDNVTIENTPQNDLAAISMTGNQTPSVGVANNYTINIFNWGTNTQSNYTVKLFRQGDIEVASVPGVIVLPNQTVSVILSWTPATQGATYIYGKVVLNGDQNPLNDQTPNYQVLVQPEGTTAITIGAGDQLANIPVNMYWRNSLFETIYQASDIPAGGMITGITFYNSFVTNLMQKPTKIWLGMTAQDELNTGWIPSTQLTLVFDGLVDYPSGENAISIPFSTPFPYAGTNLVMLVNRPMDTTYFSWSDRFYSQMSNLNSSLEIYSDMDTYDPANPPFGDGTLSGMFPKTTLYFSPAGPNPVFGITPLSKNFGTILLSNTASQVFTMYNSGGAPLTVNTIALTGSPMFNLINLPTLPLTLNPGQNVTFTARYQPTAAGAHTATITITDNLTRSTLRSRNQYTVALSGNCVDATIYTSPYFQNFDTATPPALPIDWQRLRVSTSPFSFVNSTTNVSYSTPNSIQMYNEMDASATLLLIAPPLGPGLNITAMRIKFRALSFDDAPLQVGIISDVLNASTFQEITMVNPTANWNEFVVTFQMYTGTGTNIALKHGGGGSFRNIFIDDVTIETIPQNDLAALSVSGNSTPTVGVATNYTVNLFNWGSNPQNNYQVKLFKQGNIELASVNGPLINPGATAQATLSWIPDAQGTTFIYGKVVLTGDQNQLNDQTPDFTVMVQPAGTMVVTIGDGSELARIPVDMYFYNSLFETIYLASELNFVGMINGVSFYNNFVQDLMNMPVNIWLGTTTQSNLESAWIPSTNLTQVFSGTVDFPSGQQLVTIPFPQPFLYLQDNLVMMVQRPMDNQYYSSQNTFYSQTIGTNRARNVYSDWDEYDPANPPDDWALVSGQFPKTSFMVIPGGVGHLNGTVYGAGNVPLNNATVQIVGGTQTTTNAQGAYSIMNLIAGTYQVTVSRYGYISQTVSVEILEDETTTQNFSLLQMPTVNVTGTVVGSDNPTVGISGATIVLTGYENYTGTTNAQGFFTISGVYTGQTYQYVISALGYQVSSGTITVGTVNYSMGTVILNEIAYSPTNVVATLFNQNVVINWQVPDPNVLEVDQSFEDTAFPPANWTRTVTNNGPPNTQGVYPTWCRIGTVTSGTTSVIPTDGVWQAGFWWDYNHQNEWLITPAFSVPQNATLRFDTYAYYGSLNGDHYYVKLTNNNGVSWDILWDASTQTGGWNQYQTPVQIDLSSYAGQQVKIAWHADDPPTNDGMWYNWFIDNISVGNSRSVIRFKETDLTVKAQTDRNPDSAEPVSGPALTRATDARSLSYNRSRSAAIAPAASRQRALIGYKVWRLVSGQEQNENTWFPLTPNVISDVTYTDNSFGTLPAGTYKWAVKAVYTNNVYSLAAFSNAIVTGSPTGTLTGTCFNKQMQPIAGATINAGGYGATTNVSGAYTMQLPPGTYNVTLNHPGHQQMTMQNIVVTVNQTTTCNFVNVPVPVEDEVIIVRTELKGNYPNPFNPSTTIRYDVKGAQRVRIDIYNIKGQLIRTLVNEPKATGHHSVVWDGRDNAGKAVTSGIYHYKMQSGDYKANRRMMLMK